MKRAVIIAAGGSGKRLGKPKQFLPLLGKPVVAWTVEVFKKMGLIDQIVLVVSGDDWPEAGKLGVDLAESGAERQDSVRNGLRLVKEDCGIVLVHDGARPLITADIIERAVKEAAAFGAAVVGVPVKDTIKTAGDDLIIKGTVDRSLLWQAQTPQVFRREIITRAYENPKGPATDDSKLVEDIGIKVKMVMGSYENIKITTPEDIIMAEAILRSRNVSSNTC